MLFLSFVVLLAGATGQTTVAAPQVGSDQPSSTQPADQKVVCRTPEPIVGSRLRPKRVCMKEADWNAEAREHGRAWERRSQAPSGTPK